MKLLSGAGLAGLAGCLGDDDGTAAGGGDELIIGWAQEEISDLDLPHVVATISWVARRLFASPLRVDEDLEIHGDLATDWEFVDDGEGLVFELRDDVVFHNGDEFTAEDLKFGINRNFEEDSWRVPGLEDIDSMTVVDDTTLEMELSQPNVALLLNMTTEFGGGCVAIPKDHYEEVGRSGYEENPISAGPWEIDSWDPGTRLTLNAHEDYHLTDNDGNQLPYLDTVHYDPIPETSTMMSALENGDIHMASEIEGGTVEQADALPNVSVERAEALDWWAIAFNTTREPFDTPRRRRGFAKLLDREEFVEQAQFDEARPAVGPIPPEVEDFGRPNEEKDQSQAFAPDEGLAILEDEGIDDASIELLSSPLYERWMRNVRSQFQDRAPNLDVELRQIQQSEYWTVKGRPNLDYDISLSYTTQMLDPDGIYTFYRQPDQGGVINETGFGPDTAEHAMEVNDLLGEQRRETDHERRVELFHEIEDLMIQDAPDCYMMHTNDILAVRDEVEGFTHPPSLRPIDRISLSE